MRRLLPIITILVAIAAVAFAACNDDDNGGATADGRLKVVTTVSPITSIAENIGGDRIHLEGIIPEGVNSHTYEPAPSVASVLSDADLIVINGLFLEEPTLEMAEANKRADAVILKLGENTISESDWQFDFSFPESDGHPNPHLWPNPLLGRRYAELIHEQLVALDPGNADYYDTNYAALTAKIDEVDRLMMEATATVPPENRKLLTYHDSWAYWAPRYGFEVVGAVQPSDFSQPSARDVAGLIDQIREEDLPAVFGSEVFPSDVLETIADEAGAQFIDELRDDDLPGAPGDLRHTYLGLIVQNMEIMLPALGGSADAFADFDPGVVFEGESGAVYPQ
jgi:ABC-type Zn uptake system ZnuABC Zn-binding protein ZnuA